MTPLERRALIHGRIGMDYAEVAALLHVGERTVEGWCRLGSWGPADPHVDGWLETLAVCVETELGALMDGGGSLTWAEFVDRVQARAVARCRVDRREG